MSIQKTLAIPLYWTGVSNTSRIVTWLTAHYGKLSTSIKGDQRKNSLFRGQYDLFCTSELLFYERTERGAHIARECALLHPRNIFHTDWRACAAAGYIAALFAKTTPRHAHEPGRFEFFEEMLTAAESFGRHPAFLAWFDLKFAGFQGQLMQLDEEPEAAADRRPARRFSADYGGIISAEYAQRFRIPFTPLSAEAVDLLRAWQQAPSPAAIPAANIQPEHLAQIERVLEKFVVWQFDLPPHVRKTAAAILRTAPSPAGP